MQDEQVQVQPAIDPVVETPIVEETTDTRSTVDDPAPATSEDGHADVQKPEDSASPGSTETPEQIAQRREEGKLRKTQEELKKLQETNTQYLNWVKSSPQTAREALVKVRGYTEAQADEMIKNVEKTDPDLFKQWYPDAQPKAVPVDPQRIKEELKRELRTDMENETTVKRFFETLPDLAPSGDEDTDKLEEKKNLALDVDDTARRLRSRNPDMPESQAWLTAYKFHTGKSDEDIAKVKEEGRLEGLMQANGARSSTSTNQAPGQPPKGSKAYNWTAAQRQAITASGMSEDDYAKYNSSNTSTID